MAKSKQPRIIDTRTKAAKYFHHHQIEGLSKTKAAKKAGITDPRNVTNTERTETYKALAKKYAEAVNDVIGIEEVAEEHKKNIVQDQDKGAKNNAIKLYLERVEPEAQKRDQDDQMIVILRD